MWCGVEPSHTVGAVWFPRIHCGVFGVVCGVPLPLWTWCGVLTPPHFVVWCGVTCGAPLPPVDVVW